MGTGLGKRNDLIFFFAVGSFKTKQWRMVTLWQNSMVGKGWGTECDERQSMESWKTLTLTLYLLTSNFPDVARVTPFSSLTSLSKPREPNQNGGVIINKQVKTKQNKKRQEKKHATSPQVAFLHLSPLATVLKAKGFQDKLKLWLSVITGSGIVHNHVPAAR